MLIHLINRKHHSVRPIRLGQPWEHCCSAVNHLPFSEVANAHISKGRDCLATSLPDRPHVLSQHESALFSDSPPYQSPILQDPTSSTVHSFRNPTSTSSSLPRIDLFDFTFWRTSLSNPPLQPFTMASYPRIFDHKLYVPNLPPHAFIQGLSARTFHGLSKAPHKLLSMIIHLKLSTQVLPSTYWNRSLLCCRILPPVRPYTAFCLPLKS